ncbi:MAG: hypothetical protein N3A63_07050 [Bacteroidetes bacterium]|nr:hypothetical protein [Bacteroidota bacterium]
MEKVVIVILLIVVVTSYSVAASPPDTTTTNQHQQKRARAHFIDEDGDGIADERTEGLGFKKKVLREQTQYGKSNHGSGGETRNSLSPQGKSSQQRRGRR